MNLILEKTICFCQKWVNSGRMFGFNSKIEVENCVLKDQFLDGC